MDKSDLTFRAFIKSLTPSQTVGFHRWVAMLILWTPFVFFLGWLVGRSGH